MKTLILLVLCFFILDVNLFAALHEKVSSDTSAVEVTQEKNTFYVKYFNKTEEERDIIVSIFSEQNQVVFSESIKSMGSFRKPYNFSGLPDGIYIIKITDDQQVIIRPVQFQKVGAKATMLALEEMKKDLVPVVNELTERAGKFKVSIYAKKDYKLVIKILDGKGNTLFEEEAASKTAKVYDLSKIFSGKFYFQFYDTNQNLIQEIVK